MKFLVSSSALLRQLTSINGVISTSPVVPILENFLFEIQDGTLTITASDLQTSMITEMPIDSKDNGRIAVPARILIDTLKNLPEQPVNFSVDEDTYTIEISSDNGRYKLAGENATDFPKVPSVATNYSVEMPADILEKAIANTIIAASNDELRPSMMGVFVDLSDTSTTFVATDGHRLIRYRRVDIASDANISIIIPKKSLNLLKSAIPGDANTAKLEFNTSNAFLTFGNLKMICRLIDERFPDYQNAIPANNPNQLFIDRLEFLNSLKRIAIYANKSTYQVRLKLAGSELQISAEDLDFSNEANERLSCEYEGQDMEIGFNAKFLIEMLSNLDARRICLHMSVPSRAGLITPAEQQPNEDILMLVMPVMLANYA